MEITSPSHCLALTSQLQAKKNAATADTIISSIANTGTPQSDQSTGVEYGKREEIPMINVWKLITGSLNEKNFEAKTTNTKTAEGKDNGTEDRRCSAETTYDDTPSRRRSTDSCYIDYYDDDGYYDDCCSCGAVARCDGSTYSATDSDFYIGVDSNTASTVYLPTAVRDGKVITVKAEMKPPLGNRKVTIKTKDGTLIDGYSEKTLQVSNQFLTVIRHESQWWVIGG